MSNKKFGLTLEVTEETPVSFWASIVSLNIPDIPNLTREIWGHFCKSRRLMRVCTPTSSEAFIWKTHSKISDPRFFILDE